MKEQIGNMLRNRRRSLKLTLSDVAGLSKVSIGYLSQIELGKNSPSIETLVAVCGSLDITLSDLFYNAETVVEVPWKRKGGQAAHVTEGEWNERMD